MAIDLETKIWSGRELLKSEYKWFSSESLQRLATQVETTKDLIAFNMNSYSTGGRISSNTLLEARQVKAWLERMHTRILELL